MVGVPGRSKGCQTCLKRRVKCDERRPTCGRCEKAGYRCAGYERKVEIRTHTFVRDGANAIMRTSKPAKETTNIFSQPMVLLIRSSFEDRNQSGASTVPPSLNLVAFKENIEFSFLFDNFVWRTYSWPWLELSANGKLGKLSLDASRSIARSVFGKHHHQRDIELQGNILYGQAIRGLSEGLCDPAKLGAEELIIPILLLFIHSCAGNDTQATSFHIAGLSKVIQSCEPLKFAKLPLRAAFESARGMLFTISLMSKKRMFFEHAAWKTDPWLGAGTPPKSPQNQLVDILVNIPGYLEDLSNAEDNSLGNQMVVKVVEYLKLDLATLYQWRWDWERANPHAATNLNPEELPPGKMVCNDRVFPKVLWFRNFTQATEIALYNTTLCCILGLLWQFEPPPSVLPANTKRLPLLLPGQYNSLRPLAEEICRTFEYQVMNVQNSRESALFWLLPVGAADKILKKDPRFDRWISSMLHASKKTVTHGTQQANFVFNHLEFINTSLRWRRHNLWKRSCLPVEAAE